ncbi:hypothetical protein MMC22_008439 [Lobaria immixta]|nr:hypothetical protein [Lobaria immixta]
MEAVVDQVKGLAGSADEAGRSKILDQLRELAYSLESPDETMNRIMFLNLQIAAVRVGINLGLFDILAASETPLSLVEIKAVAYRDSILLERLLRYLSSVGMMKETGADTYAATNITHALASKGNQAGVRHFFDIVGPAFQELPNFLEQHALCNHTEIKWTVFQTAWKTQLPAFLWYEKRPEAFGYFNEYMASRREGKPTWLSVYPVEDETKGWNAKAPVFVDIGGGVGHQCVEFRKMYPKVPGRVILLDLSKPIDDARPAPDVERHVYDFFRPQPFRDAKFYYMRNILHDYPDDKCRTILRNTMMAMGKDSKIIIDEMVLPDSNVSWQATQVDLTMFCRHAAMERTQTQWQTLLDSVGLEIENTYVYTAEVHESVLVAVHML